MYTPLNQTDQTKQIDKRRERGGGREGGREVEKKVGWGGGGGRGRQTDREDRQR